MPASRLHICLTCVRDRPLAAGESSLGRQLLDTVRQELKRTGSIIELRSMHCLNGCRSPCNAAFRGAGKYSLRFSRLLPDDASALLAFARLYTSSNDGAVPESVWPEGLYGKLTARTPPPSVLRAD